MGKVIYAEETVLSYLKDLSKLSICSTGLILGQSTTSNDYVVLLVRTPEQSDTEIQFTPATAAKFQSVKEIKEAWVADHARHVTKMLPGGMWVLGVFICSPSNIFSEKSEESKAKSALSLVRKQLSSEPLLNANSPSSEKLLLHFNTVDFQYSCKTIDFNITNSSFKSADWKFQNNFTKWCKIHCNFDLSQPSFGGNMSFPVKDQLKIALKEVHKSLEKAMVVLNGQLRNSNEILEVLLRNEKLIDFHNSSNKTPVMKAGIFMPYKKNEFSRDIFMKDCDVELHLLGVLASQVLLSQKTTVAEAINAIKQDIVRSLTARFEMHWDSLVEEEYGSPEEKLSVHEPPRRVSVALPNSVITLNDYLFPGEGAPEVVSSFKEMLDVDISEENLEKEIEMLGDPMEFYGKSSMSFSTTSSDVLLGSNSSKRLFIILSSIFVILIAISIALLMQKGNGFKQNQ